MRCGSSLYYYLTFFTQIDIKYILNIYVYTKYENIESDRSKDRSEQRVFCQHKIDTRRGSYLSRVKFTRCLLFEHRSRSAQSSPACLGSQLSLGSRSSNIFTRKCIHTHTHKGYRRIPKHFTKILLPKPGDTTKQRPRDTANPQIFSLKNSIERRIDQSLITRFVACRSISMVRR